MRAAAFETLSWGAPAARGVLLTCEHASNALPRPYRWHGADQRLADTHWAYDPGAAAMTRDLGALLGCSAVLGRYSRLLVDLNRPLASDTLMRRRCDGAAVELNEEIDDGDRDQRLWRYYLPYHLELGRVADAVDPALVVSVHSFTADYEGELRDFEIGVLSSTEDELAATLAAQLRAAEFDARVNEPWSGKDGFMFAADSVKCSGAPGRRRAVMLEFRNDLLVDDEWRGRAAGVLGGLLGSLVN